VTWAVSGHSGATITQTVGQSVILNVAANVPAGTVLTVTATSTFDTTVFGAAIITVLADDTDGNDGNDNDNDNSNGGNNNNNNNNDSDSGNDSDSTPSVTRPQVGIPGNDGAVEVTARVQNRRATLNMNTTLARNMIATVGDDDTVSFDFSELEIDEILIPRQSVRQFAEANLGIEIILPQGTITFDAEATDFLGQAARNNNVIVRISELDESTLPAGLLNQLAHGQTVHQVNVSSGTQAIRQLDGAVSISLPYTGQTPIAVWVVDADGNLQMLVTDAIFDEATGLVTFETDYLGTFVLGHYVYVPSDELPQTLALPVVDEPVMPVAAPPMIVLTIGNAAYANNGADSVMPAAPFVDQYTGRTMVPLRYIAEALGAVVGWDGDTNTVTVTTADNTVSLVIDEALPDGMGTAVLVDSLTFVPVRFVAESLGITVNWDEVTGSVTIG